jgi:hypothetical protein
MAPVSVTSVPPVSVPVSVASVLVVSVAFVEEGVIIVVSLLEGSMGCAVARLSNNAASKTARQRIFIIR